MTDKTLADRLEHNLQRMACMCNYDVFLWNEFSNDVLAAITALRSMPDREKVVLMEKTTVQMVAQAAFIRLRCGKETKELWDDAGEIVRMGKAALQAKTQSDIDAALDALRRK